MDKSKDFEQQSGMQLHHGELARLLDVEGHPEEKKPNRTGPPVMIFLLLVFCILLLHDGDYFFQDPVGHGYPERVHDIVSVDGSSSNNALWVGYSFSVLWQMKALTVVLLSSTVTQTVHLEDQSLLVLRAPCDATLLLQSLHLTVPHTGPQFWASPASPWECAHAPGTPEEERTSVRAVAAKGYLIYLRCALPKREPPVGTVATLVIRKSKAEEWNNGDNEGLGRVWADLQNNFDDMDRGILLGDLSRQLQMPAKECSLATLEDLNLREGLEGMVETESSAPQDTSSSKIDGQSTSRGALVASTATVGTNWNNRNGTERAGRHVMESMPQHDVIILTTKGVVFPKERKKKKPVRKGSFICQFGSFWSAPSVWPDVQGPLPAGRFFGDAIACPYPPPAIIQKMVNGVDITVAQGVTDDLLQPEDAASPLHISVPLTLKDAEGVLLSTAFFHPKAPRPEPWRDENTCMDYGKKKKEKEKKEKEKEKERKEKEKERKEKEKEKKKKYREKKQKKNRSFARRLQTWSLQGQEEIGEEGSEAEVLAIDQGKKKRESFLCSCTQIWHKAKFLEEWVRYHAWMGIEHFIIYDNNSDDDLMQVLMRLAKTVPHPTAYDQDWLEAKQFPNKSPTSGSKDLAVELGGKKIKITVIPWPWLKAQQMMVSHCLLVAGSQCDWLMSQDVDEFFYPTFAESLTTRDLVFRERVANGPFIPRLLPGKEETACPQNGTFRTESLDFGPSGHTHHPRAGVTQGYTCRRNEKKQGKSIVRPSAVPKSLHNWVHGYDLEEGYIESPDSFKAASLFHYKLQAWPEYKNKFYRRASASTTNWLTRPEGARSEDGVIVGKDRSVRAPLDFVDRFCESNDTRVMTLTRLLFSRNVDGKGLLPWQM